MGRKMKISVVLLCACLIFPGVSHAKGYYGRGEEEKCMKKGFMHMGMGMGECKMDAEAKLFSKICFILSNAEELGITDAQKDQIAAEKIRIKRMLLKKDADIKLAALDIKEQLMKDKVDMNVIDPLLDRKYTLKKEKAKEIIMSCVNINNILSSSQLTKMKSMYAEHMMEEKEEREEEMM